MHLHHPASRQNCDHRFGLTLCRVPAELSERRGDAASSPSDSRTAAVGFGSADSGWLWSGSVPAPAWVRRLGQGIWDYLRDARTIQTTLQQASTALLGQAFGHQLLAPIVVQLASNAVPGARHVGS